MNGALASTGGLLLVGRHLTRGEVRAFDLDGAPLPAGFEIAPRGAASVRIAGLAVDADRRILVVDRAARAVRRFTLFGVEEEPLTVARGDADDPASIADPSGACVRGVELDQRIVVASRGARRHALHLLDGAGNVLSSLRPRGDPRGTFEDVVRVARRAELVCACERASGIVSVFRGEEFHFALRVPLPRRLAHAGVELRAAVPLVGNRFVVAFGGEAASALLVVDGSGRIERALAETGTDTGEVLEPTDVVVDEGGSERATRVFVVDRDGDRVQVFSLAGACYGAFATLDADAADATAPRARRDPPEA